ncbi:MAG: SCO family protein [Byssovorax sp.]
MVSGPRDDDELVALCAAVRADPTRRDELVPALREDAPVYAQRGRAAIARMRGWVLASFEIAGLPDEALPFVIEELESGVEPYLIAAAARAVRGRPRPDPALAPYVVRAIGNVQGRDDLVSFSAFGAYAMPGEGETAVGELCATLRWMGPAASAARGAIEALLADARGLSPENIAALDRCVEALGDAPLAGGDDCCAGLFSPSTAGRDAPPGDALRALRLQDQAGNEATFDAIFRGRPSIVTFFFTRCDNPRKCSLTITKLARVQAALAAEGLLDRIGTAAITYDPGHDSPGRLLQYGKARRWVAHGQHRLLRSTVGNDALIEHFQLGVGFIASLVNRHRLECFVLDAEGRTRRAFTRVQWDEHEVIEAARALLDPPASPGAEARATAPAASAPPRRGWGRAGLSILPSILVALLPKCPICWAAYMSMFGIAGLGRIPYSPWLAPLLALLMFVNLASLWARARRRTHKLGFWLAAAGSASILLGGLWLGVALLSLLGVLLTTAGSLLVVAGPGDPLGGVTSGSRRASPAGLRSARPRRGAAASTPAPSSPRA